LLLKELFIIFFWLDRTTTKGVRVWHRAIDGISPPEVGCFGTINTAKTLVTHRRHGT
jgi:hypothetical protein